MRGGNGESACVPGDARAGADLFHPGRGEDSMTCDETKLLLTDYWAQTLSETQELAFDAHLAMCENCRADAERLGSLWKGLAQIPVEEPGPALRTRFYDTLAAFRTGLESVPKVTWRDR